jgi:DNA-binding response OmpR family regulator
MRNKNRRYGTVDQSVILVVDDDLDILETISFALEMEGYRVLQARNGWEALGAVRVYQPDLVILDVILPKENGYRVSRIIKDDIEKGVYSKDIIVLLLTAKASHDPDGIEKAKEFSHAEHLVYKPFEMAQLTKGVRELLLSGMEGPHGQ